ncbi:hypothetical protein ACIQZD_14060 [Peribacillus sp. NPDC096447]|uniref:hypothetical protein n=1 Tax=Peribacillus sp. NPDC096447 TaxID=3364394 RepID=UPI00382E4EDB
MFRIQRTFFLGFGYISSLSIFIIMDDKKLLAIGHMLFVYLMFHAETVTGVIIYQSIIPIFSAALSTIIFSLPLKYLPEAIGGSAVGVVNLGMQVAGFIAPLTIGFVIDAFDGSFNGAVWLLVSFGVVCFIAFMTLKSGRENFISENPQTIPAVK